MARRIVSIWFPKLAIDRLARSRRHDWHAGPRVIVAETGNRVLIAAVNEAAEQTGIAPGMSLADARALEPGLATERTDPGADARFLRHLARWCTRFTPLVALDPPDGLFLDITGCARLFHGEANLMSALADRLPAVGVRARCALADTAGGAWALARYGDTGTVAPAGRTRDMLRDLPVTGLRLGADTCAVLKRLGLDRIGDLYPLQSAALAKRFGRATLERLRQALGAASEPLDTLSFRPPYVARMGFAEPIALTDDVAAALDILTARLCERLDRERLGCRRIAFTIERVDGTVQSIVAGTSQPVNRPDHLTRLIAEHLDSLDAGFGIERAEVTMPQVEARADAVLSLAEGTVSMALPALLDRLGNRIGFDQVLSFTPADTHIPERAFTAHAASWAVSAQHPWPGAPRPVRLLSHPEPLSDVDADGFSLRGRLHQITWRDGPERITPEWWWDDPAWRSGARDYWRLQDDEGLRLWVFETSAHGLGTRWFLHGYFS
jgi:protein ImuB